MKYTPNPLYLLGLLTFYFNAAQAACNPEIPENRVDSPSINLAQSCVTCHGENGIATLDVAPNLAGQNPLYTTIQLKAYRAGERKNEMMEVIAKSLSDDEIRLLSEYYAAMGTSFVTDEECAGKTQ